MDTIVSQCAALVHQADALLIGAGAGMGVDSGLPDFRGSEGFWRAYPALARAGLAFEEMANPLWFARDPALAWGFYGHRLHLYRDTSPHSGFALLKAWADAKSCGAFIFTSNVDGQFQKAGFSEEQVVECHGSLHHLQCAQPCHNGLWSAAGIQVPINAETLRADPPLPACPHCGGIARPNILMFDDDAWLYTRVQEQETRLKAWLKQLGGARLVVVELGAGLAVPSVRHRMEGVAATARAPLIRINLRDSHGPEGTFSLPLGAKDALTQFAAARMAVGTA